MTIVIANELSKRLFIWGVLAMVVLPRHHIDRSQWSIGGNLSHSFRKFLAASVGLNMCRLVAKLYGRVRLVADILGILQVVGLSFLCFLTPYVLQTWMAQRINIGGKPGSNLIGPLYGSGLLSILGVVLCRVVHPNFWCIKRLGNVVSAPPILQTMRMYNSLTSVGGLHHHGRGTIMVQTLVIVEYWHIITQLLCALGFALDKHLQSEEEYTQWDYCLKAFRDIAFVSDWTRVCFHGIFINLLDEMYLTSGSSSSSSPVGGASSPGTPGRNSHHRHHQQDEETTDTPSPRQGGSQMIALIQRTPESSSSR